jgi:hypothetical protein
MTDTRGHFENGRWVPDHMTWWRHTDGSVSYWGNRYTDPGVAVSYPHEGDTLYIEADREWYRWSGGRWIHAPNHDEPYPR